MIERITGVVYSTGRVKKGVIPMVATEFGCHTPGRYESDKGETAVSG